MDFCNIFSIRVFKVRESFADISTELSCLGDLENTKQLPVLEVSEVTHARYSVGMSAIDSLIS